MTKVYTGASMSLDGYISGPGESGFEHLFKWMGNGDVEVSTAKPDMTVRMTAVSAEHWRGVLDMTGAIVVGRKLFDFTNGSTRCGSTSCPRQVSVKPRISWAVSSGTSTCGQWPTPSSSTQSACGSQSRR
jgi:hypothetical protein